MRLPAAVSGQVNSMCVNAMHLLCMAQAVREACQPLQHCYARLGPARC